MDIYEACNITFLDLSDVDDLEQQEILSSLHAANSNVQLPWKTDLKTTQNADDSQNGVKKCTTSNERPDFISTDNDTSRVKSQQQEQNEQPQQQAQKFHHPPNTIYPDHLNYTLHQQPYFVYPGPPPPNYPHPTVIVSNVNFATHIPVLTTAPAYLNPSYMTTNPGEISFFPDASNTMYVTPAPPPNVVPEQQPQPPPPPPQQQHQQQQQQQKIIYTNEISNNQQYNVEVFNENTSINNNEPSENGMTDKNGPVGECSMNDDNNVIVNSPSSSSTTSLTNSSSPNTTTTTVTTSTTSTTETTTKKGNKSWASLFVSSNTNNTSVVINNNGTVNDKNVNEKTLNKAVNKMSTEELCPIRHPRRAQFTNPNCYRLGEFLLNYTVDGRTISLQPRGLINRSNYCYINSILQALLACPPVYNLLSGLASQNTSNDQDKTTPIIDGMCRFVKEFQHLPAGLRVNRRNDKNQKKDQPSSSGIVIDYDTPFEPSWIYKMLNGIRSDSFLVEGRQEDAEEFLGCILNGLNDEMLELMKLVRNEDTTCDTTPAETSIDDSDKEWQVMGPKNKGAVTRQTEFSKTPISDIFGGTLKSRIHRAGDQSTYNIQPFFTLQLNIEKVNTVREALENLVSKNQLEGVTSSKTNEEVEAWQQVLLEELPVILILHLKCFDFKLDGCTKIIKALEFPIDLKIDSKLLSSKPVSQKEKQYKLFAVVYHDGKEATKGHYVTDAFHVGYSSWIRYDDHSVKTVLEENVLKPQGTRVPYLLFYRRSDTIRSK